MYRVMIVEDELLVRMGLKNSIDWRRFDMCVIADAADGSAALELYEKEKPDLIITDLKMPVMSGMELIARIRENDKNTKIVILTCMEEFELARQAISMGVSDYIPKLTMTEAQMNATLSRMLKELSEDVSRQESHELGETGIGIIKERIIKDFLLYNAYTEKEFAALAIKYGLRLNSGSLLLCVVELDRQTRVQSLILDENGQAVRHAVLSLLKDLLDAVGIGEAACDDGTGYILIFSADKAIDKEAFLRNNLSVLRDVESSVMAFINTSVSIGLSDICSGYSSLGSMYAQAAGALQNRFFGGSGIYGFHAQFERDKVKAEKTEEMLKLCKSASTEAPAFFDEYARRIRVLMLGETQTRSEYCEQFCHLIQWAADAVKLQADGTGNPVQAILQAIQQSETLDEMLRSLYYFFTIASSELKRRRITSREVKLAVDFMEANFCGDLSLQQVAAHVGLSPSYFSSQFKKETNVNFVEYLNEVRIEKAKELLLETYLKTYEIAESVGFSENTYFCRMFKKVTGKTPSAYRKQWLGRWREEPEDESSRQHQEILSQYTV